MSTTAADRQRFWEMCCAEVEAIYPGCSEEDASGSAALCAAIADAKCKEWDKRFNQAIIVNPDCLHCKGKGYVAYEAMGEKCTSLCMCATRHPCP